ncbi:intraflagellar transport protein 81 [Pelagophyceae sp. CCMP2097]|nr:intraflagellar transport protein 81 [Pelagophyceae sp. CCMP2097]
MADPVIFIVSKLNEAPFRKSLTLVDFDEKAPIEIVQILNEVFAEVDKTMAVADVRDAPREQLAQKMMSSLSLLKFKVPGDSHPSARDAFEHGLGAGDKLVVYPVLHWLLEKLDVHRKRAYIARFLLPLDVPPEFLQDETLADSYQHYKHLQSQFKEAHIAVEKARRVPIHPSELKAEISTLEEEKKQLLSKIEKLEKSNSDVRDFKELLQATNRLRVQQDKEAVHQEQARAQRHALAAADQRKKDATKRLAALRASTMERGADAQSLLEQLHSEVEALRKRVETDLPRDCDAKRDRLARLRDARMEPQRTRDDVEELMRAIADDEQRVDRTRARIADAVAGRKDGQLASFRQHTTMVSKKLKEKYVELEALEDECAKLRKTVEQRELDVSEVGGAKFMPRDEFKKFGARLREKTHVYKQQKAQLSELNAESVTLHRTETILRSRVANLDDFLRELEARNGVRGYRETQDSLERASEATAQVDVLKEKTLDEISSMVRQITLQLKEKKAELQPQIKKLRDVRNDYKAVEGDYGAKKSAYDKVAVGLDVERQQLESDCGAQQQEALEEESRFHYLNCLTAMADTTLKRVDDEAGWKDGKGRGLLPNFKCYEDLYTNKLSQQQAFSDQLRKQRAGIEKHEGPSLKQRAAYANVEKLLRCKLDLVDQQSATIGMTATEFDMGNARVATFSVN